MPRSVTAPGNSFSRAPQGHGKFDWKEIPYKAGMEGVQR